MTSSTHLSSFASSDPPTSLSRMSVEEEEEEEEFFFDDLAEKEENGQTALARIIEARIVADNNLARTNDEGDGGDDHVSSNGNFSPEQENFILSEIKMKKASSIFTTSDDPVIRNVKLENQKIRLSMIEEIIGNVKKDISKLENKDRVTGKLKVVAKCGVMLFFVIESNAVTLSMANASMTPIVLPVAGVALVMSKLFSHIYSYLRKKQFRSQQIVEENQKFLLKLVTSHCKSLSDGFMSSDEFSALMNEACQFLEIKNQKLTTRLSKSMSKSSLFGNLFSSQKNDLIPKLFSIRKKNNNNIQTPAIPNS